MLRTLVIAALAAALSACATVPSTTLAPVPAVSAIPAAGNPAFADTSGRERVAAPQGSTLTVAIGGQSLSANQSGAPYRPRHPGCLNYNISDGQLYRLTDPALGATGVGGSYIGRLCDRLMDGGSFDAVVMVPFAVGGSSISDWTPAGRWSTRLLAAVRARPDVIIWDQGNEDAQRGMRGSEWASRFRDVARVAESAGFTGKWLVTQDTMMPGRKTSPDIRSAQRSVTNGRSILFAGDMDAIKGRQADGVHLNEAGAEQAATILATRIKSLPSPALAAVR
jgi:hypothetical protein